MCLCCLLSLCNKHYKYTLIITVTVPHATENQLHVGGKISSVLVPPWGIVFCILIYTFKLPLSFFTLWLCPTVPQTDDHFTTVSTDSHAAVSTISRTSATTWLRKYSDPLCLCCDIFCPSNFKCQDRQTCPEQAASPSSWLLEWQVQPHQIYDRCPDVMTPVPIRKKSEIFNIFEACMLPHTRSPHWNYLKTCWRKIKNAVRMRPFAGTWVEK